MLIQLSISLLLISVFLVDVYHRKVLLVQLLLVTGLSLAHFFAMDMITTDLALNVGWVIIQMAILWVYLMARGKHFLKSFGLGDVLFLFAITPLLPTIGFVLFYVTGLCFGLIIGLVARFRNANMKSLPLAGILSLWLLPFIWFDINEYGGFFD